MNETLHHLHGCGHVAVEPEKPDDYMREPDRHGNYHVRHVCLGCGARVMVSKRGGMVTAPDPSFRFDGEVEWSVPLP